MVGTSPTRRQPLLTLRCACSVELGNFYGSTGTGDAATLNDTLSPEASLEQPHPLDRFGLAVNVKERVLTCTLCRTGLAPNEWKGHLTDQHKDALKSVKRNFRTAWDDLEAAVAKFNLGDPDEVRIQRPGRSPIKGIDIRSGYRCPVNVNGTQCPKVAGTTGSFATHLSTSHRGSAERPSQSLFKEHACNYQTVFRTSHIHYFQVRTGVTDGPTAGPYEVFLNDFKSATPRAAQTGDLETRDLPSLLRVTHWDVFVEPFRGSPGDVVNLVVFPLYEGGGGQLEALLCRLHAVSKRWLGKVYEVWRDSSPSIRRLLGMA